MNIWLPIITNSIILTILIAGIFVGKKNGFKVQLAKLLLLIPACVGVYFLTPIVVENLLKIEFVSNVIKSEFISAITLSTLVTTILFFAFYIFICIVLRLCRIQRKHKGVGIEAKPLKLKSKDKKTTRKLKREQKKLAKANRPKRVIKTKSKVFGAILGFIIAVVVSFAVILPTKYIFKDFKHIQPELTEIEKGFEYTPYGQLDKVVDLSKVIK